MKNIISIMLIASLGILLVFTGCKEDEYVAEPLKTVTIKGHVLTELDLTNVGMEKVSKDLIAVPEAGYTYQILQYETTVTDGNFTITLPTVKFKNIPVEVTLVDFVARQTQPGDIKKDMIFTSTSNFDFNTTEGETYYKVFNYDTYSYYEF